MPDKYGIVVGVDGSAASDAAIRWATREAILRDELITLLHVVAPVIASPPEGPMQANFAKWQKESAQDVIEQARKTLCAEVGEAPPEVRAGVLYPQDSHVVSTLIDASKQARMVVAGSCGMGAVDPLPMGSVSTGLVHHAHCPVAVIRGEESSAANQNAGVLVGIDGSPASEVATAWAFDEASRQGLPLVALHAWSDVEGFPIPDMDWRKYESQGEKALTERLAGWQEKYPNVRVQRRLEWDQAARWLIEESEHAQLVVVGSHGRGGFAGMPLGSVGTAVAQSAKVPVVVVRTRSGVSAA
jgi:nucleotide-binding universal stress UspA family protein